MKTIKKWWSVVAILVLASMLFTACAAEPETVEKIVTQVVQEEVEVVKTVEVVTTVEVEKEVMVTPEPEVIERNGAWLDTVVFVEEPSADAAVSRLEVGDIDAYFYTVSNAEVIAKVDASEALDTVRSFGSYNELSLNPAGPVFEGTGKLNPFAVPAMREALNWLIDREYVSQEIMSGLAVPRWTAFNGASGEAASAADTIRQLEIKYAYNPEKANEVFTAGMEELGAELVDGKWQYEGAPVEIIVLIRTEDERRLIGDYVATQLENIGFTAVREYKTSAEASPIWMRGNPNDGLFHIYTGGWITTVVPRDMGDNFQFFYTSAGYAVPLWQAYVNTPEFYDLAQQLANREFANLEERRAMVSQALEWSLQDSHRIWLVDRISYAPKRKEVLVGADLYGSISGSYLWAQTLRREGEVGGSMTIGQPSILTEPWNPLNGTNWIYDMTLIRGTGDVGLIPDPYTGLYMPQKVESFAVTMQEGLPTGKTLDWLTLDFAPEIVVPEDAWVDWDATTQRFITAGEVDEAPRTALRKMVVTYPSDLFTTVKWHDGSFFSMGDVVMYMIMQFDRAKEASANYDESYVPDFEAWMGTFKGVKIISVDPLVIETYDDSTYLDAEDGLYDWWPYYSQGEGAWHAVTLGLLTEARGEAAFSAAKADADAVEWLSYIAGPTVDSLKVSLDEAQAGTYIPYAATLGEYITADEATTRYANMAEWYRIRGHFWVGTGPFFLLRAFPVEGNVILERFPDYPDSADKWLGFSAPAIPEIDIDGPDRVTIGQEATYDIYVTFEGEDYAVADIAEVKFLVFDAKGEMAYVGVAEAVEDGLWQATLSAEITGKLEAGSNKLEAVVVSKRVALPSFFSYQFVTQ